MRTLLSPRGSRGALALLALAAMASGCGDPTLWARWRAERAFWHAQRDVERILVRPQVAKPADYARAEAAFRKIVEDFPAARWARPSGTRMEGDVAEHAGRASLALARLAELQGRTAEAAAGYGSAETEWAVLPELALEAAVLRAGALDRAGETAQALAAWERVLRAYEPSDPTTGARREAHAQALRRLAAGLEARGAAAARDSLLRDEAGRAEAAIAAQKDRPAALGWLDALAEARAARGDFAGSFDASRRAISGEVVMGDAERARRVVDLGERLLATGRADSALGYARWGAREFHGASRVAALDLAARAHREAGHRDSALASYDTILHDFPRQEEAGAEARFQRAILLEAMGRWVLARTEYSALCAATPSHPRALESWARVVRHHREAGEQELARIETGHALAAIDQMLAMQHEPAERARGREARAAVLFAGGRTREAGEELQGLWTAIGIRKSSAELGELVAREAETGLRDPALARSLWQILARSSPDLELRSRAVAALERLRS